MKHLPLKSCVLIAASLGFSSLGTSPVAAAVLKNGWQYAIDVGYDSLAGDEETDGSQSEFSSGGVTAGGTIYEAYGIAIKDDVETNTVWVGLNGNLPTTGRPIPGNEINGYPVPDGNIGWGDLFFDFTNVAAVDGFKQSSDSNQLWAVRFAENNDSGVLELGLYQSVQAKSVVPISSGWSNLYNHNVNGVRPRRQLDAWMGDTRWNDDYYQSFSSEAGSYDRNASTFDPVSGSWSNSSNLMLSNIHTGTKVADITPRSQAELEAAGFESDFFFEEGSEIFGFSFEKPLGFVGDFIATLLSECINDGMALLGSFLPPEPPPLPPPPPEDCPVTLGQLKSLIPDEEIEGEWKRFYDVASHKWYDPPAWTGMEIVAEDGTLFTQIFDFPCGISTDDQFLIQIGDSAPFEVGPGVDINFIDLVGGPIHSFKIFWDESLVDPNAELPFAIQLGMTEETGSFQIINISDPPDPRTQEVPEPTSVIGFIFLGVSGWFSKRWLRKDK